MKFFVPTLLLAAGASAAQDCDGAPVLEQCLITTTANKNLCASQDYNCLCTAMRAVYMCFNSAGCPDDERASGASSELQAYCAYETTTTAVSASVTPTGTTTSTGSETTPTDSSDAESDNSTSGDDTNSGTYLAMNAGGMMVAVAGVIAVML